jgi:FtsP/CotA-like multicopper oxidase with cupredoxin domain
MKTQTKALVNTQNLSDTNELKFRMFSTPLATDWVDVYYKGQRIAIINGLSSAIQWTAKNGSNIPVRLINKLENYCRKNLINY